MHPVGNLDCQVHLNFDVRIGYKRFPRVKKDVEWIVNVHRPFDGLTKYFIDKSLQAREKAGKKTIWKSCFEGIYILYTWKTAQGLRARRVYDIKAEYAKRLEPSKITRVLFNLKAQR